MLELSATFDATILLISVESGVEENHPNSCERDERERERDSHHKDEEAWERESGMAPESLLRHCCFNISSFKGRDLCEMLRKVNYI